MSASNFNVGMNLDTSKYESGSKPDLGKSSHYNSSSSGSGLTPFVAGVGYSNYGGIHATPGLRYGSSENHAYVGVSTVSGRPVGGIAGFKFSL